METKKERDDPFEIVKKRLRPRESKTRLIIRRPPDYVSYVISSGRVESKKIKFKDRKEQPNVNENEKLTARICELEVSSVIAPEDGNPRQDFQEQSLFDLGHSLQVNTQLAPIIVNRVGGRNYLVAGERRLRAAKLAKLDFIEAKVFEDVPPLAAHRMAMAENRDRVSLNPIEQARGMQKLLELGMGEPEIAVEEHCALETVRRRLSLLKLPGEVQKMIVRERCPLPVHQALLLLKLPRDSDRLQMARKAAPKLGPVAGEDQVRQWIDETIGKPLPGMETGPEPGQIDQGKRRGNLMDKKTGTGPGKPENVHDGVPPDFKPVKPKKVYPIVEAGIGMKGKLEVSQQNGQFYLNKVTCTLAIGGEVEILTVPQIYLPIGDPNSEIWKKIVKRMEKAGKKQDEEKAPKTGPKTRAGKKAKPDQQQPDQPEPDQQQPDEPD